MANENGSDETNGTATSRRTYLQRASGGFVGAGLLGWRNFFDGKTEIVTHLSGNDPVITEDVPTEWYDQKETADRVKDKLFDRYQPAPGILGVGVTAGDSGVGGYRFFDVEVHVHEDRGTDAGIPETVDGINVTTRERLPYRDGGCNHSSTCYDTDYDPIPGGVQIGDGSSWGTSCWPVEKDNTTYLMGARHVWIDDDNGQDSCSTNSAQGSYAYQNGDYYGWVEEEYEEFDAVLTQLDGAYGNRDSIGNYIVDEYGDITGHVSNDGVDTLIGSDESVEKRGVTHCSNSGTVDSREDDYCSGIAREDLVRSTPDFGNGDSGGPVYDVDTLDNDDYLFLVHIATQYPTSNCDNGYGSAAYAMNNDYGITF